MSEQKDNTKVIKLRFKSSEDDYFVQHTLNLPVAIDANDEKKGEFPCKLWTIKAHLDIAVDSYNTANIANIGEIIEAAFTETLKATNEIAIVGYKAIKLITNFLEQKIAFDQWPDYANHAQFTLYFNERCSDKCKALFINNLYRLLEAFAKKNKDFHWGQHRADTTPLLPNTDMLSFRADADPFYDKVFLALKALLDDIQINAAQPTLIAKRMTKILRDKKFAANTTKPPYLAALQKEITALISLAQASTTQPENFNKAFVEAIARLTIARTNLHKKFNDEIIYGQIGHPFLRKLWTYLPQAMPEATSSSTATSNTIHVTEEPKEKNSCHCS